MKQQPDQQDEFHGVGGSYVIDPATGLRRRAGDIPAEAQTGAAAAAPASAKPAKPATAIQSDKPGEK